ncbi:MAG: GtrA family protein [Candidatus Thiodiazotropha sp. 6PLUC1]
MNLDSLKALSQKLLDHQFLKYLVVGGSSWVVDFLVFYFLYPIIGIIAAQTAARVVGALIAFIGHKTIVFDDHAFGMGTLRQQLFQYLLLWIVSYSLSIILLLLFVDLLQLHPVASKIITEAIIIAINFVTMRRYIFNS